MRKELKKFAHIFTLMQKYLLTINEANTIQITQLNAVEGGFGRIHYGNYYYYYK